MEICTIIRFFADIQKTKHALDTTLSYYVVANEIDLNLKDADPATNLQAYLRQLEKLKGAIEFFGRDNAYKTQLDTAVRSSFDFYANFCRLAATVTAVLVCRRSSAS